MRMAPCRGAADVIDACKGLAAAARVPRPRPVATGAPAEAASMSQHALARTPVDAHLLSGSRARIAEETARLTRLWAFSAPSAAGRSHMPQSLSWRPCPRLCHSVVACSLYAACVSVGLKY